MAVDLRPVRFDYEEQHRSLLIEWSDGAVHHIPFSRSGAHVRALLQRRARVSRTFQLGPIAAPRRGRARRHLAGRRVRSERGLGRRTQHGIYTYQWLRELGGGVSVEFAAMTACRPAAPALLQSVADGVLTLTLNRPDVLNAITPPLLDELTAALHEAAAARGSRRGHHRRRSRILQWPGPPRCIREAVLTSAPSSATTTRPQSASSDRWISR